MKLYYTQYERLGDQFLEMGDLQLAIENYEHSLSINPQNYHLLIKLIDAVVADPNKHGLLKIIDSFGLNLLNSVGRNSSVHHMDRLVSILNRKIMSAKFSYESPTLIGENTFANKLARSNLPKVVLLTCTWGRRQLTEIVLSYYQLLRKQIADKVDLILVAVGSEGNISRMICDDCDFHYFEYSNLPLNEKWNFGLRQARVFNADGVVTIGSDDLVTANLFIKYAALLNEGVLFFGLKDAYFFDLSEPTDSIHWHGYGGKLVDNGMPNRLNETIGLARLYSNTLLEHFSYSLWDGPSINRGLDGRAKEKLTNIGMLPILYEQSRNFKSNSSEFKLGQLCQRMSEINVVAVDIKINNQNVTSLNRYKLSKDVFTHLTDPWSLLTKHFPTVTVEKLKSLSYK